MRAPTSLFAGCRPALDGAAETDAAAGREAGAPAELRAVELPLLALALGAREAGAADIEALAGREDGAPAAAEPGR